MLGYLHKNEVCCSKKCIFLLCVFVKNLGIHFDNFQNTEWSYATCPDIDECALNLHDCHTNATCINVPGSYKCQCNKGYIGNGRDTCTRTCFEDCIHGKCSQGPDYECICDLGYTGSNCNTDCGCNGNSACDTVGPGHCDDCRKNTQGEFCDFCAEGSFGNATSIEGTYSDPIINFPF